MLLKRQEKIAFKIFRRKVIPVTIQQLSVFLAVCEEMNYTRAAARAYMTRQAVRQNIAELEKELCGLLFENCRNHLHLTEKGKLLRENAAPFIEHYYALQRIMNADIRLKKPIRLGISVALVPDYLPSMSEILQGFQDCYSGLSVDEVSVKNDEAVPALLEGQLDACMVMDLGGKYEGTVRTVLTSHQAGVLMGCRQSLFTRKVIEVSDLRNCILFVPGLGREFDPLFEAAGQIPDSPRFEVMPSFYQVLFHVMDNDGIAINRYVKGENTNPTKANTIPLDGLPLLCSSFVVREEETPLPLQLLRDWIGGKLQKRI